MFWYSKLCTALLGFFLTYYVMLCSPVLCCYNMLSYNMLFYNMLCYNMLWFAMLCYVMLCCLLCCVMLCYVMLCCAMFCYVLLCYVILDIKNHEYLSFKLPRTCTVNIVPLLFNQWFQISSAFRKLQHQVSVRVTRNRRRTAKTVLVSLFYT